jgi:hypothetical protein
LAAGSIVAGLFAGAQSPSAKLPVAANPETGRLLDGARSAVPERIVRQFEDTSTGHRWLLIGDALNPSGPGHMVQVASDHADSASRTVSTREARESSRPALIIHAGDKLILEEHSPAVDARLEAVALGSAGTGGALDVRLRIGGRSVHATCVAPGRAVLRSREVKP